MRLRALAAQGLLTATRLYLVRHGQVADGHTDVYNGHVDVDFSSRRRQPMRISGGASQGCRTGWHLFLRSDPHQARGGDHQCTAGDLAVKTVPEFREINFGIWEGLSFKEIMTRYPEELQQRFADLANFRIPEGESLKDLEARVAPKLADLIREHSGEAFLVVAHAGINRVILSQAMGLSLQHIFHLDQAYAGLNIIDYYPDLAVVRLLNGIFYPTS